jgi:hypothetical protein
MNRTQAVALSVNYREALIDNTVLFPEKCRLLCAAILSGTKTFLPMENAWGTDFFMSSSHAYLRAVFKDNY